MHNYLIIILGVSNIFYGKDEYRTMIIGLETIIHDRFCRKCYVYVQYITQGSQVFIHNVTVDSQRRNEKKMRGIFDYLADI